MSIPESDSLHGALVEAIARQHDAAAIKGNRRKERYDARRLQHTH
jgi:hypothetical protein